MTASQSARNEWSGQSFRTLFGTDFGRPKWASGNPEMALFWPAKMASKTGFWPAKIFVLKPLGSLARAL